MTDDFGISSTIFSPARPIPALLQIDKADRLFQRGSRQQVLRSRRRAVWVTLDQLEEAVRIAENSLPEALPGDAIKEMEVLFKRLAEEDVTERGYVLSEDAWKEAAEFITRINTDLNKIVDRFAAEPEFQQSAATVSNRMEIAALKGRMANLETALTGIMYSGDEEPNAESDGGTTGSNGGDHN